MKDVTSEISDWFKMQDDSEFLRLSATHPYSVAVLSSEVRQILYTTKPGCVLGALERASRIPAMKVVGRMGLPNEHDGAWLTEFADGYPIAFLGDADPADLLVFAWLRSQMPVVYVGVSDKLVQRLGVQVDDSLTIPLTDVERQAIPLLAKVCPDYGMIVGRRCAALLSQGRKIEIEALVTSNAGLATLGEALVE